MVLRLLIYFSYVAGGNFLAKKPKQDDGINHRILIVEDEMDAIDRDIDIRGLFKGEINLASLDDSFGEKQSRAMESKKELLQLVDKLENTKKKQHFIDPRIDPFDALGQVLDGVRVGLKESNTNNVVNKNLDGSYLTNAIMSAIKGDLTGENAHKAYYGRWGTDLVHDPDIREASVRVGRDDLWGGVGLGLADGMVQNNWGVKRVNVNNILDQRLKEIGTSVAVRDYMIGVDHSAEVRSSAIDVATKRVALSTLTKQNDRDYGQRVKVKDVNVLVRHDFDNWLMPDSYGEAGTEFQVGYKGIGMTGEVDRTGQRAGFQTNVGSISSGVILDADDRKFFTSAATAGGWQWLGTGNLADLKDDTNWARIGFGKQNVLFTRIGAGINKDGTPMLSHDLQTKDLGLSSSYKKAGNRYVGNYTMNFGKVIYMYESEIKAQNLMLPKLTSIIGGFRKKEKS